MERAVAIKKLGKLIGKGFGYRIDNKAPSPEERVAAKAEVVAIAARRDDLDKKCNERRRAILAADAEYQNLLTEYKAARKQADELFSMTRRSKITVGKANGLFFMVKAEGDSWEEVIGKVEKVQERLR